MASGEVLTGTSGTAAGDLEPSPQNPTSELTITGLETLLRAVDPAVRVVPSRLLRRVIRENCGLPAFRVRVPHAMCYTIAREPLIEILGLPELGWRPEELLPADVVLVPRPSYEDLENQRPETLLRHYWRLLFHARVHGEFQKHLTAGRLTAAVVRRRMDALGLTEFAEVRSVLEHEHLLLPPADDVTVYIEFVATYLEFRYFDPRLLASYFPALEDLARVERVVAEEIDAAALLKATRPTGAATLPDDAAMDWSNAAADWDETIEDVEPTAPAAEDASQDHSAQARVSHARFTRQSSDRVYRRWTARAEKAARSGNLVASAICRTRAERWTPRGRASEIRAAIRRDIQELVQRLRASLALSEDEAQAWRAPLWALVRETPRGIWTVEARLLYDLQKVCIDHDRGVWTVDLVEWTLSLGRRPIKRPLPGQREVLTSKHLRSAVRRLAAVRISDRQRHQLAQLLRSATQRAEERLRDDFRPLISATLDEVDLEPQNLPERVARNKLVEELLDRIVERGFLTLGDLRDAISRNNLKQPDVARPADFILERVAKTLSAPPRSSPRPEGPELGAKIRWMAGLAWQWGMFAILLAWRAAKAGAVWAFRSDPLLRADRRLATALDGVYQRGEFYLRWMQRFSSLAFGTRTGRFLTRYLIVPLGGACLILGGLDHLLELVVRYDPEIKASPVALGLLSLFLFDIMHWPSFRAALWRGGKTALRLLRTVFVDGVRWIGSLPVVEWLLHSRPAILVWRYLIKPLVPTLILWQLLPRTEGSSLPATTLAIGIFLAINLAVNSRVGRSTEEIVLDWIVEGWHRFGVRILSGLFWLVIDLFRGMMQTIERILYSVDEWLRFRSGEGRFSLAVKGGLGLVWFVLAYVVRFGVNVLVEPQINPIKHFPVVTVAHKFLLPLIPSFGGLLALTLDPAMAYPLATLIIWGVPGVFGFLVWELKENWRLYAANRPQGLRPVRMGRHGETMTRLLKPGFHSGTLPKRFAKLRRAERAAGTAGQSKGVRKQLRELQQIEQSMRRYVEREFIELFTETHIWTRPLPSVGEVRLASNRLRVAIEFPATPEVRLWLSFDMAAGWMLADGLPKTLPPQFVAFSNPGEASAATTHLNVATALEPLAHDFTLEEQQVLATAILGLYKTSGVDVLKSQIEAKFRPAVASWKLVSEGIVAWPSADGDGWALYDLHNGPCLAPQWQGESASGSLPLLDRRDLLFRDREVRWSDWVDAWGK